MTFTLDLRSGRIPQREVDPTTNSWREMSSAGLCQWLRLTLGAVFALSRGQVAVVLPNLVIAVALLFAGPTGGGALAEFSAWHDVSSRLWHAEPSQGVAEPLGCQLDGESSALADFAEEAEDSEESEAEGTVAAGQVDALGLPHYPTPAKHRDADVMVKVAEWVREHHAPRGPPLL